MGAPVWPPSPEEAARATWEEYSDLAAAKQAAAEAETDAEAEQALLRPFLFGAPPRVLSDGEPAGTPLDGLRRGLVGWLTMLSGLDLGLLHADPPATNGRAIFLPRFLPAPAEPAEDALIYRIMGLMQAGLVAVGYPEQRGLLVEIHRDWVLRSAVHLLYARAIRRRWISLYQGLHADFTAIRLNPKARGLRVNHTPVPRQGLPPAMVVLLVGLSEDGVAPNTGPAVDAATRAVRAVESLPETSLHNPTALAMTVLGQATALRDALRAARLGPPPLPSWLGILRPEWILDDRARDRKAEEAWREGPAPLRLLRDLTRKNAEARGATSRLRGALGRALGAPEPAPAAPDALSWEDAPPPDTESGYVYDAWDHTQGTYRLGATRVIEQDAPAGPPDAWDRLRESLDGPLREVRRRFEALKVEERWETGQEDGPELDLGRVITAITDLQAGISPRRPDWHLRFVRQRRDLAVLVLMDLSGSVQGGALAREQEALVLLAEGLGVLGLPHAFYGFQTFGARDCQMLTIKGFDEPLHEGARRRASGLRAGGGTRLGAVLRHATWLLSRRPQSRRLILLVSDGRPEDRDGYRGPPAVHDTAVAAAEARRAGVVLHCTSLDTREGADGRGYLREIFGEGRYLLLERVDDLPVRLPEVLRGLVR